MKFTDIKKKLLISSLAIAMVVTSASMNRIHGESNSEPFKVTLKKVLKNTAGEKKALLKQDGTVTGRTNTDTTDNNNIHNLSTITDLMIDTDVTRVPERRFLNMTGLTKLSFKEGTTNSKLVTIEKDAFRNTGITSVTFPKALTTIGAGAFADNKALAEISFANSKNIESIKVGAFENCMVTSVDLSPIGKGTSTSLTVEEKAFKGNKSLTNVTLSTNITEIAAETFSSTGITTYEISKDISVMSPLAFNKTPLKTLTVNSANTSFDAEANVLYNKAKTKLVLYPEGKTDTEFTVKEEITHIDASAFTAAPYLTKIITGTNLTNIGEYAFAGASKLKEIILNSKKLVQIGQYAFSDTAITSIALMGTIPGIEANAFSGAGSLTTLDLRKATAINSIKANAFKNTSLNSMIISKNTGALKAITKDAFKSNATKRQISFMDDKNTAIIGKELTDLIAKYQSLTQVDNGGWTFDVKFQTPAAVADYKVMKLKSLEPSASYTINDVQYTADAKGELDLLKTWGGTTIRIVRNATAGQSASDAQSLTIEGIYSVSINGTENSIKKVGDTVSLTAPAKPGYVFTKWMTTDVKLTTPTNKNITFQMPSKDVQLTQNYTKIEVETLGKDLLYNGKDDVKVSITSVSSNFSKLLVGTTELNKDTDYTVTGLDTTILTLKHAYLTKLLETTQFTASFTEGGNILFRIRLLGAKPVAIADYGEMKLTGLVANAEYKINNIVKTADANGKIDIEKAWSTKTLDIVKVATKEEIESQAQQLKIEALYSITVNGQALSIATAGTAITLQAERKSGFKLKEWSATGITLKPEEAKKEEIKFTMPANDVDLQSSYTKIITTKPEDMLYDGTKEVEVRFDIPMNEFEYIEYAGKRLVLNEDYTVKTGSTIITFTKTFLDKMKGDITGINAVFTNATVDFSIKLAAPVPPVVPNPPVVNPNPPVVPAPPVVNPTPPTNTVVPPVAPNKATVTKVIKKTGTPKTGDTTNIYLLGMLMMLCIGAIIIVKKKIKQ